MKKDTLQENELVLALRSAEQFLFAKQLLLSQVESAFPGIFTENEILIDPQRVIQYCKNELEAIRGVDLESDIYTVN